MHHANRRIMRLGGLLYLTVILLGLTSEVGLRGPVVVPCQPTATAALLREHAFGIRLAAALDTIVFSADAALAVLLFVVLRRGGAALSGVAAALRLTGTAVYGASMIFPLAAVLLLEPSGLDPSTTLVREDLSHLSMIVHGYGYDLGLVFFGGHCLLLGALLARIGHPRLGGLMAVAGTTYLVGSGTRLLAPGLTGWFEPVYALALVGEVALTVWLLRARPNPPGANPRSSPSGAA